MKQARRILEIDMYNRFGASTLLKGCGNATLAALEIDSFLKPWVRDGQVPMPKFLSRRENEVGYALDTLEKMPSSEVLDLLSIENENGYIRYVGVLIARGIPAKNVMTVDECKLKDYKSETLASLECVPFLKPWVQECLTSKLRILSRHEVVVRPDFDTLEKMHSSEAFDLVSGDANKRDYKDYVEMLIARGLLDKNAMIVAYNKSYCGFPSALLESCFLEETDPKTRSNTYKDRYHNTEVNDDVLEENYMTVCVKTINRNTISVRYYGNMTSTVILEEVERRTMIPRDMIRLVHKGKAINGKKSMKENNIKANETIEMSLRLLGGMEADEHMDTHETEEDREKKGSWTKEKRGKRRNQMMNMAHQKKDIMEALRKSDEEMECYSRKTEEKMNDFSKKADDLLERFMIITNTVATQIQGMNSSIVKLHETNEKMKDVGKSTLSCTS